MRRLVLVLVLLGGCGDDGDGDDQPSKVGADAGTHRAPDAGMHAEPVDAATPHDAGREPSEAPDAPEIDPLQCHILCTSNDASGCTNAPDHETCFDACMSSIEHCPELVAPLIDCLGALPKFSCDVDGNVISDTCAPEPTAVQACVAANAWQLRRSPMNFGFTEQQEQLRAQAQKVLRAQSPMPEVRRVAKSDAGYDAALFARLGELGMLGLLVPEAYGGAGLSWVDAVVLLEATGHALLPSPLLSQLLVTGAIAELGSEEQKQRLLAKLVRGERIAAPALFERGRELGPEGVQMQAAPSGSGYVLNGEKSFVADAASAALFLVAARSERGLLLALVEREQPFVRAQGFATIDTTKRMGTLTLDGARIEPQNVLVAPPEAAAAFERLLDMGAVAVAAEGVGAASAALALTVDYAKTRKQFGHPIGKFQGVKHPLAEMHVELETAKSLVYYAGWALSASPEQVPRAASMAKAQASEAFARIGVDAIQLHGAIGYTDEYDAQLYLKRSKWARPQYGDADHHYDRLARLLACQEAGL